MHPTTISTDLKLIRFSASDEERDELDGMLEEMHVLVHHPVDYQETVGPARTQ